MNESLSFRMPHLVAWEASSLVVLFNMFVFALRISIHKPGFEPQGKLLVDKKGKLRVVSSLCTFHWRKEVPLKKLGHKVLHVEAHGIKKQGVQANR